jgi:plastocyanin
MKKTSPVFTAIIIAVISLISFQRAESTIFNVAVASFTFTPSTVNVTVGDTVKWNWVNGSHTTTCDGTALTSRPAGAAAWSSSINSTTPTFSYKVTVAGTYNYKCNPHGGGGMLGVIIASPLQVKLSLTLMMEGFWNGAVMVQDTVKIFLKNGTSPYANVDSAKIKLNSTGKGTYTFSNAPAGNYYIAASHRNSITTWSRLTQSFVLGATLPYDFTTLQTQAYGNNMILKSGKYVIYGGDVNKDETIDASDVSIVDNSAYNSSSGYILSDLNGDDFADASDLSIVDNNAGNSVSVIRP